MIYASNAALPQSHNAGGSPVTQTDWNEFAVRFSRANITKNEALLQWNTYSLYVRPDYDFEETRLLNRLETHHRLTGQWPLPPVVRTNDQSFPLADAAVPSSTHNIPPNPGNTSAAPGGVPSSQQLYQQSTMTSLERPGVAPLNRHERRAQLATATASNNNSPAFSTAPATLTIKKTGYNYCAGFSWQLAGDVLAKPDVAAKIPMGMRHDCRRVLSFLIAWRYHPLFNSDSERQGQWISFGTDRIREELGIRCDRVRINFREGDVEARKQLSCLYVLARAGLVECHRLATFDRQLEVSSHTADVAVDESIGAGVGEQVQAQSQQPPKISLEDVEQLQLDAAQLPVELGGGGPQGYFHRRCFQYKSNFYVLGDLLTDGLPDLAAVGLFNPFQFQQSHQQQQQGHHPATTDTLGVSPYKSEHTQTQEGYGQPMFGHRPGQSALFEPNMGELDPAKSEHLVMSGDVRTLRGQESDLFDHYEDTSGQSKSTEGQPMVDSSLRSMYGLNGGAGAGAGAGDSSPILFKFRAYNNSSTATATATVPVVPMANAKAIIDTGRTSTSLQPQPSLVRQDLLAQAIAALSPEQKQVYHLLRQAHRSLVDYREAGMGRQRAYQLAFEQTARVQEVAQTVERWQQDWNSGLSRMHRPIAVLISRLEDFDPTATSATMLVEATAESNYPTANANTASIQMPLQPEPEPEPGAGAGSLNLFQLEQARLARRRNFLAQQYKQEQEQEVEGEGQDTSMRAVTNSNPSLSPGSRSQNYSGGSGSGASEVRTSARSGTHSGSGNGRATSANKYQYQGGSGQSGNRQVSNSGIRFEKYLPGGKYNLYHPTELENHGESESEVIITPRAHHETCELDETITAPEQTREEIEEKS